MIDLMSKKWLFFVISGLVLIPGIISLFLFRLPLSIDFTGGSLWEVRFQTLPQASLLHDAFVSKGVQVFSVQPSQDAYIIRIAETTQEKKEELKKDIAGKFGPLEERRFETVGPSISKELTRKALIALVLASLAIVLYISWSFRQVPSPASSWRFGATAIVALLHDVFVVIGSFSLLGKFFGAQVDALFVTALLTVIGFSVHDTIVVYDRIRENLPKFEKATFSQVVNHSVLQTLGRSINTSLTVVLVLNALLLFGGETIRWFVVALLIGVISGTYSSIFNASPLLVLWHEKTAKSG